MCVGHHDHSSQVSLPDATRRDSFVASGGVTRGVCGCVNAGYEVYSGGAEVAGHEVADGASTDGRLPAADPPHVHVGLRRPADSTQRPARPLDARLLRRQHPDSAAAPALPRHTRRPPPSHGRRLGRRRHRQITAPSTRPGAAN